MTLFKMNFLRLSYEKKWFIFFNVRTVMKLFEIVKLNIVATPLKNFSYFFKL